MSLLDLIKKIEKIAKLQQGVHSVFRGDIYDNWNKPDVQYISVNVAITNYTQHIIDAYDEYEVYLYCGDRLLQDNSNEYEVLTNTQRVLVNIISILDSDEKIDVVDEVQYINFVQSFADYVAGEYVRFNVRVPLDVNNCDLVLDEPIELTINKNGIYEINGNYRVNVAVPQCEDVIELQTQIETLETEKAGLQESLNTALNQIEVDKNTITRLNNEIADKTAQINALNEQINSLVKTVDTQAQEIRSLNAEKEKLELQVSNLTNDINATREVTYVENGIFTATDKLGFNKINVNVPSMTYVEMTQAEYDALENKDNNKFYIITD